MYAKIVAAALTAVVCCARAEAQITIEEYRAAVADHSWTLQAARSAGEETRETMLLRRTDYLPQVTATGSFTRTFRRFASLEPWTSLARLGIEQNVYSGGAVRAADYAYWSLSRAESYLKAVREYIAIVGSLQKVVHRRFEEGYISKSDVLQIDSRMSDAEFGMVAAEQAYYVALHDFNVLRGQSVGQDVTLSQSILDTIDMPRRVDMATITARRPDFTASRMSIDAARWRIKSVRAAYLPKVGVGVYGAWQPYVPNSTGKTYVDGGAFISVDVPIFHFRARSHAVRSAEHAAQRSEWQSAQLYDTILTEEINGWTDIMSARAQLINSQQSLEIAAENLSISTYSYKEGLATILDVMQAQISWLQIYTNTITARFNLAVAVASYSRTTSMP